MQAKKEIIPFPKSKRFIETIAYQSLNNPDEPILKYHNDGVLKTVTFSQFNNYVNQAAKVIKDNIKVNIELNDKNYASVSYLANSNQSYPINAFGLMKLNLVPVLLSPRNSIDILVHLIKESESKVLVYGKEYTETAFECKKKLPLLEIIEAVDIDYIKEEPNEVTPIVDIKSIQSNFEENIVLILHSSGSTSYPKLIPYFNRFYLMSKDRYLNKVDKEEINITSLSFAPLFHTFGFFQFFKCIFLTSCLALPRSNRLIPSEIINDLKVYDVKYMILLPFILKLLVDHCNVNKDDWYVLKSLINILVSGALLPKETAKECIEHGVNLTNAYGLTECGIIAVNNKPKKIEDISYFTLIEGLKYHLSKLEGDTCQLVIDADDQGLAAGVVKSGENGYQLEDVLKIIDYDKNTGHLKFQILGRQDDTIIHFNGEKTNPVPIEAEITSNPYIKHCLVYGTNKLYNCAIIKLNDDAFSIPLIELNNSILSQVELANKLSPSHSRIFPELVYILPFNSKKQFIMTVKGNIIRKKSIELFEEEIEMLYNKFDNLHESKANINDGGLVDDEYIYENLKKDISDYFYKTVGKSIVEDKHFFSNGMDSLTVVKFRNLILSKYPTAKFTINNIYENDTIINLSQFIDSGIKGKEKLNKTLEDYQNEVDQLIAQCTNLPKVEQLTRKVKKEKDLNVLITGANGSLGSFIIKSLLQRNEIGHIYALSRATTPEESMKRLKKGFEDRLINLSTDEWTKITALPYTVDDPKLGLDIESYNNVFDSVDIIYHVAWKMDFLKGVNLFKDCIEGTINLLKISAFSPNKPSFHFTSTVGATLPVNITDTLCEQPLTTKLSNVAGCNGYNLSKLVCEAVAQKWSQHYNFDLNIHRVGQVSGDTINGAWNIREYIPLLIKGIQVMKIAPKNFMDISWIPVDYAANGMVEIHFSNHNQHNSTINHIVNPKQFPFSVVLNSLKNYGFEFKVVDNEEFIHLLTTKKEYQDVDKNPMASLTDFFVNSLKASTVGFSMETKLTQSRAVSIHTCPAVNDQLIFNYLDFWKSLKFLN